MLHDDREVNQTLISELTNTLTTLKAQPESPSKDQQLKLAFADLLEALTLHNYHQPPLHVKHADLTRVGDSEYKSDCPECGYGVLLVNRDPQNFRLQEQDRCVLCGQPVIYDDIGNLRWVEGETAKTAFTEKANP